MSVRITPLTRTLPENCATCHLLWLPQNQLQYTRRKKPRKQYWAYFGGAVFSFTGLSARSET